jgi:hypothetical protein
MFTESFSFIFFSLRHYFTKSIKNLSIYYYMYKPVNRGRFVKRNYLLFYYLTPQQFVDLSQSHLCACKMTSFTVIQKFKIKPVDHNEKCTDFSFISLFIQPAIYGTCNEIWFEQSQTVDKPGALPWNFIGRLTEWLIMCWFNLAVAVM